MDRISLLSDDLILKILSLVPSKVAVATSLLSKRWCSLWKHVPKLEYSDPSSDSEYWRASRFVDKFLLQILQHGFKEAPVLETLHLGLSRNCPPTDIATWIQIAVSRGVRDLRIVQNGPFHTPLRLPSSLYTCKTLVTLRLSQTSIMDVPRTICFRSLKALYCACAAFSSGDIIYRLLAGCPVLEELTLGVCRHGNLKTLTIVVPSLLSVVVVDLTSSLQLVIGDDVGLVIKAPSLQSLVIEEFNWVWSMVDMPNLVKASINLRVGDSKKLIRCLTSARHLSLCVKPPMIMDSYPIRVFEQLVSLRLCTCSSNWFRFMLRLTPELRRLRFLRCCCRSSGGFQTQWERPSSVPQCLVSSLETVEWNDYKGTEAEKEAVMYLLENSERLKKMAIIPLKSTTLEERHKILQELSSAQRSSSKCRLSFT